MPLHPKTLPLPRAASRRATRSSRGFKLLATLALASTLAGCATITVDERTILRPDQRPPAAESLGASYVREDLALPQADDAVSRGVYFHSPLSTATVLYFGGSSFRLDIEGQPVVTALARAGMDVMIFDYRGYGRSDGTPTAALMRSDAQALARFARSKAHGPLVVYGLSLGSFVASAVAETEPVDALVLEGTATNAQDMVDHRFPWYAKLVARPKFSAEVASIDNVKALRGYQGPLLVLSGEDDEMMPPSLQRSLYEQVPTTRKAMRLFAGYGHKGLIESPEFTGVLRDFLAAQLGARRD
jgi:hypothetical protein